MINSNKLDLNNIYFCVVAYKTLSWMELMLGSFKTFFPLSKLIVVDNNILSEDPSFSDTKFLRTVPDINLLYPDTSSEASHGAGIDLAVKWCRKNNIEFLVLLEPDCLILGCKWFNELCLNMDSFTSMVGSHKKKYGPIHPTPSLWRVSSIEGSFRDTPRGSDMTHPNFREVFDYEKLINFCNTSYASDITEWFKTMWDTAQQPWFYAAIKKQARLAPRTDDFIHFWQGSQREVPIEVKEKYKSFTNN